MPVIKCESSDSVCNIETPLPNLFPITEMVVIESTDVENSSTSKEKDDDDDEDDDENSEVEENKEGEKSDGTTSDDSSEVFQVEKLIDAKFKNYERYFKVRWQGYGEDEDTWEPESSLRQNPNIVYLIEDYLAQHRDVKPKVIVRRIKEAKKPHYEEQSVSEEEDWYGIRGDETNREARNLYVRDRIPTETEKILSQIEPGIRVLRNHLRSSFGTTLGESSSRSQSLCKSETPPSVSCTRDASAALSMLDAGGGVVAKKRRGRPPLNAGNSGKPIAGDARSDASGGGPKTGGRSSSSSSSASSSSGPAAGNQQNATKKQVRKSKKPKTKTVKEEEKNSARAALLSDTFTCDDVGGVDGDEPAVDKGQTTKSNASNRPITMKRGIDAEPKSRSANAQKLTSMTLAGGGGGAAKVPQKTKMISPKASQTQPGKHDSYGVVKKEKHRRKRRTGDEFEELRRKMKRSSDAGMLNLACRRTTLESEQQRRREEARAKADEESQYVRSLCGNTLKPPSGSAHTTPFPAEWGANDGGGEKIHSSFGLSTPTTATKGGGDASASGSASFVEPSQMVSAAHTTIGTTTISTASNLAAARYNLSTSTTALYKQRVHRAPQPASRIAAAAGVAGTSPGAAPTGFAGNASGAMAAAGAIGSVPRRPSAANGFVGAAAQMQKVSRIPSSGTIIDSLIPVSAKSANAFALASAPFLAGNGGSAANDRRDSPKAFATPTTAASTGFTHYHHQKLQHHPTLAPQSVREPPTQLQQRLREQFTKFSTATCAIDAVERFVAERLERFRLAPLTMSQEQFDATALEGRYEEIRAALDSDQGRPDPHGGDNILLHKVCEKKCSPAHDYCNVLEVLVRGGARLDMCEPRDGHTPLHVAVAASRLCRVRRLLALRSPVNRADYLERTPIVIAFDRLRLPSSNATEEEILNALLRAGATFQIAPRYRCIDRKAGIPHQKHLQATFERAFNLISSNIRAKPISPIFVNPLHEKRDIEHSFAIREFALPGSQQAFCVFTALCNMKGENYEARMFGYTPVLSVAVNDRPCQPLTNFVYLAAVKDDQNKLKIQLDSGVVWALSRSAITGSQALASMLAGAAGRPNADLANFCLIAQLYTVKLYRQPGGGGLAGAGVTPAAAASSVGSAASLPASSTMTKGVQPSNFYAPTSSYSLPPPQYHHHHQQHRF